MDSEQPPVVTATHVTFGDLLRHLRRQAYMTQRDLALATGYSIGQICRFEQNQCVPDLPTLTARFLPALVQASDTATTERLLTLAHTARATHREGQRHQPTLVPAEPGVGHTPAFVLLPLPIPATPLLGREQDVARVCALLRQMTVRLLTLTGPGGIGKTRLGLQVAAELLDEVAEGAWFVNLAPISDPTLLAVAVAQTFGIKEQAGRTLLDSLKDWLRKKQLLLLLDNFEQIVVAAPLISELLGSAPGLKVLVTSRMPLRLSGEHEFAVAPLGVPPRSNAPQHTVSTTGDRTTENSTLDPAVDSVADLTRYTAMQLFIERAQAVKADFAVTNANALAVAEICFQLDGLPLAIELAAAWVKIFPPSSLLTRLEHRLQLLTVGARDLPARQQTIRNTIDWSYQLLDAGEQRLFARLAVFVGGWTLEAADAVCTAEDELGSDVLNKLAALVDQSLLRQNEGLDGNPRFVMLETIREYALERLEASGKGSTIRQRHAEYYLALAEKAEPMLFESEQPIWLNRFEQEHDNLRAALAWALAKQDARLGLQLVGAMGSFWNIRGPVTEGRRWLQSALTLETETPKFVRAKALSHAAYLALIQSDYVQVRKFCEASLSLYRELSDQQGVATALRSLGMAANALGDYTQADTVLAEALHLYHNLKNTYGVAAVLQHLGFGRLFQGDFPQAHLHLTESVALFRCLGLALEIGETLTLLGITALLQASVSEAATLLTEGLGFLRQVGDRLFVSYNLVGLAGIAVAQLQPQRAVQLFGAAEILRESLGLNILPASNLRLVYEGLVAAARSQMDEMAFAAAWAAGQAMTPEQAVVYALGKEGGISEPIQTGHMANATQ